VTIFVNNASVPFRPGEPLEHWTDTVQTDLLGSMFCTRAAIEALRPRFSGREAALAAARRPPSNEDSPATPVCHSAV
jgi:NAD(P)-dependent dehydrogenase (short-subunit alcohol dehydrogenase family)